MNIRMMENIQEVLACQAHQVPLDSQGSWDHLVRRETEDWWDPRAMMDFWESKETWVQWVCPDLWACRDRRVKREAQERWDPLDCLDLLARREREETWGKWAQGEKRDKRETLADLGCLAREE